MSGQQEIRGTKNLGLIQAIYSGINPPLNTKIIWYDDNLGVKRHKYYDVVNSTWVLFGNGVITINGHYVYIAYASSCLGADFSLIFDEEIHTHTSIISSPTSINENALTPELFSTLSKWIKYCSDESIGGNYTYIAFADDSQGTNFSLEQKYEVECELCKWVDNFSIPTDQGESLTYSIIPINGGINIDFDLSSIPNTIKVDLLIENVPLQNGVEYFIEVQIPASLTNEFYVRLDESEVGGQSIIPNGQNQTLRFKKINFSSILFIEFHDTSVRDGSDVIFVKVGTATCENPELEPGEVAQKCYKCRTCFAIISSDTKIEQVDLVAELFENKWFCICCDKSSNSKYDIENLKQLVYNISSKQGSDKEAIDSTISALNQLYQNLLTSVGENYSNIDDRLDSLTSGFASDVEQLATIVSGYLQQLASHQTQINELYTIIRNNGYSGVELSPPFILNNAELKFLTKSSETVIPKTWDAPASITDSTYLRTGFISNIPFKDIDPLNTIGNLFEISRVSNLEINIDKNTWTAIKDFQPFIQISRYRHTKRKGIENPLITGKISPHYRKSGFKVNKIFSVQKPSKIFIREKNQVLDFGQEHYFKFDEWKIANTSIFNAYAIGLGRRNSSISENLPITGDIRRRCWVYLQFSIGISLANGDEIISKPLGKIKMILTVNDNFQNNILVAGQNSISFKYI